MSAEMIEKPLTEAQRIIARLEDEMGIARSDLARRLNVRSSVLRDIRAQKASGVKQLSQLRMFLSGAESPENHAERVDTAPATKPATNLSFADPAEITLNADEPAPAEPKKLTERAGDWLRAAMLGEPSTLSPQSGMSAPSARKKARADASEQGDLIEQLVPLAALLFVLSGSVLISDPYKPCGPNNDEATAIAYPIVKRAVRELDARRKLSEATTDAIAILLAVSAYGVRAHGTWQAIHAEEVQRVRSNRQPNRQPSGADFVAASGGGPVNAASTPADAGAGRGVSDANAPLPFWRGDARAIRETTRPTRGEPRREPATPEQRHADASIDALLAADHAGRQRLGL